MKDKLDIIRGIHPGFIVDRELKRRKIRKVKFASDINEFAQTLTSITKGKRKMNPELSIKIGQAFGWEEDFLMILQSCHDVKVVMAKNSKKPDLSKIRPVVFWDTDIQKINWETQREAVIDRILKRGNEQEKREISKFYGIHLVNNHAD